MRIKFCITCLIAIFTVYGAIPAWSAEKNNAHKQKTTPKLAWEYQDQKDEMTGEIIHHATTNSLNKINLDFPYRGGTIAWLELRKHPRFGKDVIFEINRGQFNCSSYDGCKVTLKFDDNPPIELHANSSSDNRSTVLFIKTYDEIVDKLKTSTRLIIEAEFYQAGLQQFRFNVAGITWD